MRRIVPLSMICIYFGWACQGGLAAEPEIAAAGAVSGSTTAQAGLQGLAGTAGAGGAVVTSASSSGAGATAGTNGGAAGIGGSTAQASGGVTAQGGRASAAGSSGQAPITYALPPPSQCHNQDYIDYQEGCREGDVTSKCAGKCNTINACLESSATKPHADTTFICPRFMLFSDQMRQAAVDDGNAAFNYAVVGHDVDRGGIDGQAESTCCQCYQLVFAYPSPNNDRQGQLNPDDPNPPASAIPVPPPMVVQSFNTAATAHTFDIYMAAGGLGANNACAPGLEPKALSGQYLYTAYPDEGQPSQGGVKPASLFQECKTSRNWVTTESLSQPVCRARIEDSCNELQSELPGLTDQARRSCLQSNDPLSFYHLNWSVYVMKVECPSHLTQVTGCKLAPQGLPAVKQAVTTAALAAQDSQFWSRTSAGDQMYETTTMEDCCRPSCASVDWISGRGLRTDPEYNAFYSCNAQGNPITQ